MAAGSARVNDAGALQNLAAQHGIAVRWRDIWGKERTVAPRTLRAILAAMGVRAAEDAQLDAAQEEAERRAWRHALPPAVVVWESTPSVELRLSAADVSHPHELRIGFENGGERRIAVSPDRLALNAATDIDGKTREARELPLPKLPLGYHRVLLCRDEVTLGEAVLIVAPDRCYEPQALRGSGRVWGPAVQLYALRSERNWGIGDFTDLRALLEQSAARGASLVGLNPLHALFPHDPARASPYGPSSRLFLNVLYIDPEIIADFRECETARALVASAEFQTRLAELREAPLVDYAGAAEAKHRVFEQLYASFRARHLAMGTERARAFRTFLESGGRALELNATYEALQEHFHRADPRVWGWPAWPAEYRDPNGSAVARLRRELAGRCEYHAYLQWQAELQLGAVGRRALELDAGVGLYGDLALSMDRGGAEAWAQADCLALDVGIGAPPDDFNLGGQNWGLPPFIPERLREARYAPFIALLRACMRHNGALRLDHVMGLQRLYWVPAGVDPAEGAYVTNPFEDLLAIVALESHRNGCLVIGEDLGTVPDELRAALARRGVLSYRPLYFERDPDGSFRPPSAYPVQALATATTHDLPTLAGFWAGSDLLLRAELGQFPAEELRHRQVIERAEMRAHLLLALEREHLLPEGGTVNPVSLPHMTPEFVRNLQRYLARSRAKLLTVQLEDIFGVAEQINLPGVGDDRHPNWRRKLDVGLERFAHDARFRSICEALRAERPKAARPEPARAATGAWRTIIPRCTYRLQLNARFTLRRATELIPYLSRLGASHVYCSPYFRARPGSEHGYDIIDHNELNPEIGTHADFERFVATLRSRGMGHILDVVPNHVGVLAADNAWWNDVLENGEASIHADFFDIDWRPANAALTGKVLIPVLADPYGTVLERGELALRFEPERGCFTLGYHAHRLPLNPRSYPLVLQRALEPGAAVELPEQERAELQSLLTAFRNLPPRRGASPQLIRERHRDKEIHKRRLAALCARSPACGRCIDAALRLLAGEPGQAASFEPLHEILEAQAYRLAYWRVASDEINYRRFFDINDLAALRMENAPVFEATHRLVLDLIATRQLDGVRIDHPDGLYDPQQYFTRIQQRAAALLGAPFPDETPPSAPVYLVIEKIAAPYERLPESWPVHGTTGYDFANLVNGLFIDGASKNALDRLWRSHTGEGAPWPEVAYECKRLILRTALASELTVLANALARIAQADRRTRDFTLNTLRLALIEIIASFPVYRTYVSATVSDEDRRYVDWAVAQAKRRSPAADVTIFDFIRGVLLGEAAAGTDPEHQAAVRSFAIKFQQVTAPVMAKGVEDTAFYRFTRFVSLNEVGGDPDNFGVSVRGFHRHNEEQARRWPHTLLATSTHDSKRSEDVRARLDVLSEMPAAWRQMVRRWARINRSRRRHTDGDVAPSRSDEYLLYQTLVGTWPLEDPDEAALGAYRARIEEYMIKALREAKLRTSWLSVNSQYEEDVLQFVRALLAHHDGNLLLDALRESVPRIARLGLWNSLGQLLCKLTAPGVPDVYQGTELWDFSLVDPDNRRAVDFELRMRHLRELESFDGLSDAQFAAALRSLVEQPEDGRCKMFLLRSTLAFRARHEHLFNGAAYQSLPTSGARARHLCAYARRAASESAIVVVPRLVAKLLGERVSAPIGAEIWGDTAVALPQTVTGETLSGVLDRRSVPIRTRAGKPFLLAANALAAFPVALLT